MSTPEPSDLQVPWSTRIIRGVALLPEAVSIEYLDTGGDLRANGLTANHVIYVPRGEDYDDEILDVTEAAHRLLKDVLEDFTVVGALDLKTEIRLARDEPDPDDEDDDD